MLAIVCSSESVALLRVDGGAEHFQTQHFACDHDTCLERKFVVFASQQELKQHQGKEHAGGMSAAERRRHLNVPINLQACRAFQLSSTLVPTCAHSCMQNQLFREKS